MLGARAVERPRSDPEGAAVRPDQRRGQPRRGRQGAATTTSTRRRRHSYLQDALQVSAAAFPYARAGRGEPPPRQRTSRSSSCSTPALRRRPLLRCVRRIREGRARRHADADHGRTIAGRKRRRCTCCRSSGSATRGRWKAGTPRSRSSRWRRRQSSRRSTRRSGAYSLHADGDAELLFMRQRDQRRALVRAAATPGGSSRTRSTSTSSTAAATR